MFVPKKYVQHSLILSSKSEVNVNEETFGVEMKRSSLLCSSARNNKKKFSDSGSIYSKTKLK